MIFNSLGSSKRKYPWVRRRSGISGISGWGEQALKRDKPAGRLRIGGGGMSRSVRKACGVGVATDGFESIHTLPKAVEFLRILRFGGWSPRIDFGVERVAHGTIKGIAISAFEHD